MRIWNSENLANLARQAASVDEARLRQAVPSLVAQIEQLRHGLEDICARFEARDTGEGFPAHAGGLCWAMYHAAKRSLGGEEDGAP